MKENSLAHTLNSSFKIDKPNLKILEDQLSYESMMNKKLNQYALFCDDAQLKNICYNASKTHKNNFEELLNYLNLHQ